MLYSASGGGDVAFQCIEDGAADGTDWAPRGPPHLLQVTVGGLSFQVTNALALPNILEELS